MISLVFRRVRQSLAGYLLFALTAACVVTAQQTSPGTPQAPTGQAPVSGATTEWKSEDLTSLSITSSNLHAAAPLLGEKDDSPTFSRELLRLEWRPNDPIYLYVILPKGVPHPPAILYLYSYPSDVDTFRDDGFCKLLTKDGVAAIGFVSALTGQRYHDRPMKEWFISELADSLVMSTHDVQMILNYLAGRGDLDMQRIGMFGEGSGATIAILAASVDPRLKVIDLLDPWGDWPDWLAKSPIIPKHERATYVTPAFLRKVQPFDPLTRLSELSSTRTRLQEAEYEKVTPKAARKRLESTASATLPLVRYKNSEIVTEMARQDRFFDWIKSQLQPSSLPLASDSISPQP